MASAVPRLELQSREGRAAGAAAPLLRGDRCSLATTVLEGRVSTRRAISAVLARKAVAEIVSRHR